MLIKTDIPTRTQERDVSVQADGRPTLRGRVRTELEAWGGAIGRSPRSGIYFILGALLIVLGFLL